MPWSRQSTSAFKIFQEIQDLPGTSFRKAQTVEMGFILETEMQWVLYRRKILY